MALEDAELALRGSRFQDPSPPSDLSAQPVFAAMWRGRLRIPNRFAESRACLLCRRIFRSRYRTAALSEFTISAGRLPIGSISCSPVFAKPARLSATTNCTKFFREVRVVDVGPKSTPIPPFRSRSQNTGMRPCPVSSEACVLIGRSIWCNSNTRKWRNTATIPARFPLFSWNTTSPLRSIGSLPGFKPEPQLHNEYRRWLDFERIALQCSNQVWTMSNQERSVAIDHGASRHRTKVIPNGVDLRRFTPAPMNAGPPVVLFVGSFRHLPNLLAFELRHSSIMPIVWKEFPEAVLHVIAGPHHERAASLAGKADLLSPHPRIVIEGFVEDVRPAYGAAAVVAVPLPLSAGTNIKLLEAMACGRAIVSTPAGCRGLDLTNGLELVVTEPDSCFAAALVNLLRDEDLRTRLAIAARRTAEQRFGWDRIAEDAFNAYVELTASSRMLKKTTQPQINADQRR